MFKDKIKVRKYIVIPSNHKVISYDDLDKHFTTPKELSPFFKYKRIPRKIKKRYNFIFKNYEFLDNNQKLWYILNLTNPNYVRFIIKKTIS
jgi:hypothetical protein